jgi:hypothetical protein
MYGERAAAALPWGVDGSPAVTESHRSDLDLVVLQTLRCIGYATEERVAWAAGLGVGAAAEQLGALADRGLVSHLPGPFEAWGLSERGRTEVATLVANELEMVAARASVRRAYEAFLELNPDLLRVCHDWQLRRLGSAEVLNDHTDIGYDEGVLRRLVGIDVAAQQICVDLGGRLRRFANYGSRFRVALEQALAGDPSWVTDRMESYHSVWFQLHEDLLVTLGLSREDEGGATRV